MRYFYTIIFYLLTPFIVLRLLWRSRKSPGYRQRILERFGFFPALHFKNCIWVHAVSFGEAKIATHLIQVLQKQQPDLQFVITTMTVTGSQQISPLISEKIRHVYIPYDLPGAVKRFLKRTQPKLLMNIETELWPTILYQCHKQKIPVIIANARLSEKSFQNYYRLQFFMRQILKNITQIWAQTDEDAQRFIQLGAMPKKVLTLGNVKFDVNPPTAMLTEGEKLKKLFQQRSVWVAASTHPEEENLILEAFALMRKKISNLILILVPRHPERFSEVLQLCQQRQYHVIQRSNINLTQIENIQTAPIDVLLGNSMGELWLYYAASDVAFVGGSLINQGGHNLLEPAALGLPIITGNYYANFQQIAELLLQAKALTVVKNPDELAKAVTQILQKPELGHTQGQNALQVIKQNQGSLEKYCEAMKTLIA